MTICPKVYHHVSTSFEALAHLFQDHIYDTGLLYMQLYNSSITQLQTSGPESYLSFNTKADDTATYPALQVLASSAIRRRVPTHIEKVILDLLVQPDRTAHVPYY